MQYKSANKTFSFIDSQINPNFNGSAGEIVIKTYSDRIAKDVIPKIKNLGKRKK